jgi:hypothetical protein
LSATTTISGGRVCAARARTQARAVPERFMVAKTAAIMGMGMWKSYWLFVIGY